MLRAEMPAFRAAAALLFFVLLAVFGTVHAHQRAQSGPYRAPIDGCEQGDAIACYRLGLERVGRADSLRRATGDPAAITARRLSLFREASAAFERACELRIAAACTARGDIAIAGLAGPDESWDIATNPAEGIRFYELACDSTRSGQAFDPAGCVNLEDAYSYGIGVERGKERPITNLDRACRAGLPTACMRLGTRYSDGDGVPRDLAVAESLYRVACSDPRRPLSLIGCTNVGYILDLVGDEKDKVWRAESGDSSYHQRALAYFLRSCSQGEPIACSNLGIFYQNGRPGVQKDLRQARTFYQQSCPAVAPIGASCWHYARFLLSTATGLRDTLTALTLLRRGCDATDGKSCLELGYLSGELLRQGATGVASRNDQLMASWLGCEYGAPLACVNAGIYLEEFMKELAVDQAVALYARACDLRHVNGCRMAMTTLDRFKGDERAVKRAAEFRRRACALDRTLDVCGQRERD